MYQIKGTYPDTTFHVVPRFTDAEGITVPSPDLSAYSLAVTSDNEASVSVASGPVVSGNEYTGVLHFGTANPDGSPATSNLAIGLTRISDGTLVASDNKQFVITAGDAETIAGIDFTLEGITES